MLTMKFEGRRVRYVDDTQLCGFAYDPSSILCFTLQSEFLVYQLSRQLLREDATIQDILLSVRNSCLSPKASLWIMWVGGRPSRTTILL